MMDFHSELDPHFMRSPEGRVAFRKWVNERVSDHARSRVTVAELGGKTVGYLLAKIEDYPPVFDIREYGHILDLAVTWNFRRMGLGEALVRDALDWMADKGVTRIEAATATANEVSNSFWEAMGFKPYMTVRFRTM